MDKNIYGRFTGTKGISFILFRRQGKSFKERKRHKKEKKIKMIRVRTEERIRNRNKRVYERMRMK